jgi:hypothetical protein
MSRALEAQAQQVSMPWGRETSPRSTRRRARRSPGDGIRTRPNIAPCVARLPVAVVPFRAVVDGHDVESPTDLFPCPRLHAGLFMAKLCVARQQAGESRTKDTWRGQAAAYPTCTATCALGVAIRARVGDRPEAEVARARHAAKVLVEE